jgi:hypothetical protein
MTIPKHIKNLSNTNLTKLTNMSCFYMPNAYLSIHTLLGGGLVSENRIGGGRVRENRIGNDLFYILGALSFGAFRFESFYIP